MAKRRIHLTENQLYGLVKQAISEINTRTKRMMNEYEEKNMEGTTLETFDYSQIPQDLAIEAEKTLWKLEEEGDGSQSLECHVDYHLDDGDVEVSCEVWGWVSSWYDPGNYYDRAPEGDTTITCDEITDIDINIYDEKVDEYWPQEKVDEKIKDLDFSNLKKMEGQEY